MDKGCAKVPSSGAKVHLVVHMACAAVAAAAAARSCTCARTGVFMALAVLIGCW
jgi:hypothetical protein